MYSCPIGHAHQTFFPDPEVTDSGVNGRFLVGCHSAAKSGRIVLRSLTPFTTTLFEQHGQLRPKALLLIFAFHS